jgi:hypothetical protein
MGEAARFRRSPSWRYRVACAQPPPGRRGPQRISSSRYLVFLVGTARYDLQRVVRAPITSGLALLTDILKVSRYVSKVLRAEVTAWHDRCTASSRAQLCSSNPLHTWKPFIEYFASMSGHHQELIPGPKSAIAACSLQHNISKPAQRRDVGVDVAIVARKNRGDASTRRQS